MKFIFEIVRFIVDFMFFTPIFIIAVIVGDWNHNREIAIEENHQLTLASSEDDWEKFKNINTTSSVTTMVKLFMMAHW